MKILYFIPLLFVLFLPSAYADWPFPDPPVDPVEHGRNYDREQIGPDTYAWTSAPPRLEDAANHYINYRYQDKPAYFTFESANTALTFDKTACKIKLFDPGFVQSGETPFIPSIITIDKEAVNGTDIWYETDLNDKSCQFSYSKNDQGVQITAKQSGLNIFGMGSELVNTYDIYYSGVIKQTYRHYNNDQSKPDHKYGFTQIISGDFTVRIGDQTYHTTDSVSYTKEQLADKPITITKDGVSIVYDTENRAHHYLWALKIADGKVVLDFTYSKGALPVGGTLEVDPTFGPTLASSEGSVYPSAGTGNCNTRTGDTVPASITVSKKNTATNCQIYWGEWNISSIPTGAAALSAYFEYDQTATSSWTESCTMRSYTGQPSGLSTANKYSQGWAGTGLGSVACTVDGNDRQIAFNSTGLADITSKIATGSGWYAISLQGASPSVDGTQREFVVTAGNQYLNIVYTGSPHTIALKPKQYDNSTSFGSGWIYQRNATITTIKTLNASGYAVFPSTTDATNYNYTIKDALDNFVDNKTYNKAIPADQSRQGKTNIFPISLDADPDMDEQIKVNFTNYHNTTYWHPPSPAANGDISALLRFTKDGLGPATNQTVRAIMRVLDTTNFGWSPSLVTWNGTSIPFTFSNNVMNSSAMQVGNGYKSFRLNLFIQTDNVTSAPPALSASPISDTQITLGWTAPSSTHGDAIQSYRIWRDGAILQNSTGSTAVTYTDTAAGPSGSSHTYQVCAWNRIGCSPYSGTAAATTYRGTTGTVTVQTGIVGDVIQANATVSITHASPSPVTVSALKLYRNGTLMETKTTSVSIANASSSSNFNPFWDQMTTGSLYSYKIYATVSNSTGTVQLASSNFTGQRAYLPDYFAATVSSQGLVNYTLSRAVNDNSIYLKVNRDLGHTFQIECLYQTSQQASRINNTAGTWQNHTNVEYFNGTVTGTAGVHYYIKCYNDALLFSTVSYSNSSIVLLGIAVFDQMFGGFLGVPVGVFFLLLVAGLASPRTANIYIVIVLAVAAVMVQVGFFSLSPSIWALSLLGGAVGIFLKKLF